MEAPQLYSIDEARSRLGKISRAKIYELLNSQRLESVVIDGRRLISAEAIAKFIREATTSIAPSRERAHANSVRQFPLTLVSAGIKKHS
jgi:hypothetical protein